MGLRCAARRSLSSYSIAVGFSLSGVTSARFPSCPDFSGLLRRRTLGSCISFAKLAAVIFLALFLITQNLISLNDVRPFLMVYSGVDIWPMLTGERTVAFLDFLFSCRSRDTKQLVVILICHR